MRHSVLRCVWLAAVAVAATGATACRGDEAPPHVAPGTPVGKVVDVSGQVTATRDGTTRTLAPGEDVSPDDLVATADTGSVSIELFHNRANLQLQNGATSRIDDSLAWDLTKSEVAKLPGGKVMVSAGRHGESSAASGANNVVTAGRSRDLESVPAPGAPATAPSPPPSPPVEKPMTGGVPDPKVAPGQEEQKPPKQDTQDKRVDTKAGTTAPSRKTVTPPRKDTVAADPPPPPPPQQSGAGRGGGSPNPAETIDSLDDTGSTSKEEASKNGRKSQDDAPPLLETRVEALRAKLARCLKGDVKHLTITVTVTSGQLTFGFAETGADAARACVQGVLKRLDLTNASGTTSIELKL